MFSARVTSACLTACIVFVLLSLPCFGDELEPSLKQAYEGKVFVIRSFYSGSKLQYGSSGKLTNNGTPGPWTVDGLARIKKVSLKGDTLRLKCRRLAVIASDADLDYQDEDTDATLEIDADIGPSPTRQGADVLFSKVFVLDGTPLADLVPSFWRACVESAIGGGSNVRGTKCLFSSRLMKAIRQNQIENSEATFVPANSTQPTTPSSVTEILPAAGGVSSPSTAAPLDSTPQAASSKIFPVRHGMSPPKLIYGPDPDHPGALIQGICVLALVVDSSGLPENIEIARPLGYGADEQAVAVVETWKFKPAMKDGQPVAVRITVGLSFHRF